MTHFRKTAIFLLLTLLHDAYCCDNPYRTAGGIAGGWKSDPERQHNCEVHIEKLFIH